MGPGGTQGLPVPFGLCGSGVQGAGDSDLPLGRPCQALCYPLGNCASSGVSAHTCTLMNTVIYAYTCTLCMQSHTHVHMQLVHTLMYIVVHTYIHMLLHTHVYCHVHTYILIPTNTHSCTDIPVDSAHASTYTQVYKNTCTDTQAHPHIYMMVCNTCTNTCLGMLTVSMCLHACTNHAAHMTLKYVLHVANIWTYAQGVPRTLAHPYSCTYA